MLDLSRMFGFAQPQFQSISAPMFQTDTFSRGLNDHQLFRVNRRMSRGRNDKLANMPGQVTQDMPAQAAPMVSRITADPFVSEGMAASQGNPFGAMNFSGMLGRQGFF